MSPISDVTMDTTRTPEPAAVEAARLRLQEVAARRRAGFDAAGAVARTAATPPAGKAPETFVKFEAMVLQTFLQSVMPEGEAVYGEGLAGEMWKSFLSKEIGTQMAQRGGIGIADRILGDYYMSGKTKVPVAALSTGPEKAETDKQSLLSTALVQEIQRNITKSLDEDLAAESRPSEP